MPLITDISTSSFYNFSLTDLFALELNVLFYVSSLWKTYFEFLRNLTPITCLYCLYCLSIGSLWKRDGMTKLNRPLVNHLYERPDTALCVLTLNMSVLTTWGFQKLEFSFDVIFQAIVQAIKSFKLVFRIWLTNQTLERPKKSAVEAAVQRCS